MTDAAVSLHRAADWAPAKEPGPNQRSTPATFPATYVGSTAMKPNLTSHDTSPTAQVRTYSL